MQHHIDFRDYSFPSAALSYPLSSLYSAAVAATAVSSPSPSSTATTAAPPPSCSTPIEDSEKVR